MSTIRIPPLCIAVALCCAATPALAHWSGKGDVGASFATGNSENQAASANLELKNRKDKWQHTLGLAGNYGSDSEGPGYRHAEIRDTGESEDGIVLRGDVGFEHQLTDTTRFVDRFLVEAGADNTYMQNDLGLEVTINGALGLRVGYQVRHNSDVQPGIESTDTLTTIGLLYETK